MPRKKQCRRIAAYPAHWRFCCMDAAAPAGEVQLSLEEYETIRLLDLDGLTQADCAAQMGVARTTVTAIYASARRKLAEMLVNGAQLRIAGGDIQMHAIPVRIPEKGESQMRLAIPYENGLVFQHFGHTAQFRLYDIADGEITAAYTVGTGGSGHGALAGFLKAAGADALVCGGIGGGARMALAEAGIRVFGGVTGPADAAAAAFAAGTLAFDPNATCHHHDHGGAAHSCGHRSCGGEETK